MTQDAYLQVLNETLMNPYTYMDAMIGNEDMAILQFHRQCNSIKKHGANTLPGSADA